MEGARVLRKSGDFMANAEVRKVDFSILPHNKDYELDLHKPFIDDVKLECKCGGVMIRAKEVMDVWLDSGSMPFAQDHYPFENKKFVEKSNYPADFISEAIDQTRGWFYTLHAIGTIMGFGKAYKNVICLGHILDEKGKKMSKSIGNVVDPIKMMNKYGADALRMWMYSVNQPGDSKNFEEKTVDEVVKKVFNMVDNVLSFYKLYETNVNLKNQKGKLESQNVLDKWIVARLNQLIETVTAGLDAYKFMEPTRAIRDFVADLSQWYLQSSRDRFKGDQKEKEQALSTLRYILMTLSKIMAPFAPFFADYVYLEVRGDLESVHLESWPKAGKIDGRLIEDMETTRKIVEVVLSLRSYKKIGVRQPLSRLAYELGSTGTDGKKKRADISEEFRSIVKEKLNVKIVDSKKIDVGSTSAVLEKDGKLCIDSGGVKVELDIVITPELKEEGTVRELIRAIQDLRKQKGLSVNDKVELTVETNEEGKLLIEKNSKVILAATSLEGITFGSVGGEVQNIGGLIVKLLV
jgi:isoleucyl-tRNA synthetase